VLPLHHSWLALVPVQRRRDLKQGQVQVPHHSSQEMGPVHQKDRNPSLGQQQEQGRQKGLRKEARSAYCHQRPVHQDHPPSF
jgi:hypothetical protein